MKKVISVRINDQKQEVISLFFTCPITKKPVEKPYVSPIEIKGEVCSGELISEEGLRKYLENLKAWRLSKPKGIKVVPNQIGQSIYENLDGILTQLEHGEFPTELRCPVSLDLLTDPVIMEYFVTEEAEEFICTTLGTTYNYDIFQRWNSGKSREPLIGLNIPKGAEISYQTNQLVKNLVKYFEEQYPFLKKENE